MMNKKVTLNDTDFEEYNEIAVEIKTLEEAIDGLKEAYVDAFERKREVQERIRTDFNIDDSFEIPIKTRTFSAPTAYNYMGRGYDDAVDTYLNRETKEANIVTAGDHDHEKEHKPKEVRRYGKERKTSDELTSHDLANMSDEDWKKYQEELDEIDGYSYYQ